MPSGVDSVCSVQNKAIPQILASHWKTLMRHWNVLHQPDQYIISNASLKSTNEKPVSVVSTNNRVVRNIHTYIHTNDQLVGHPQSVGLWVTKIKFARFYDNICIKLELKIRV